MLGKSGIMSKLTRWGTAKKNKKVLDKVRLALIECQSCRIKRRTGTLITEQ